MRAYFDRFIISMTKAQALSASHQGNCDDDVKELAKHPAIVRQLKKIKPIDLAMELAKYGTWNSQQLSNHEMNVMRILWIAAGDIRYPNG